MPHADSSLVPDDITTKAALYAHVHEQLRALLSGQGWWVSSLSQTASLLYHTYAGSALYGERDGVPVVNWTGFYLRREGEANLTLGPFHGRPACVEIRAQEGRGVCADAFVKEIAVVVQDVDEYPGHIACDGDTKSEIVLPLRLRTATGVRTVGVLDLDSTVLATFDDEDRAGLEEIVRILEEECEYN